MKKILFLIIFCVGLVNQAYSMDLDVNGLNRPESVLFDPKTGNYFISNINGEPLARDNNGYISKVNSSGLIIVLRFIEANPEDETRELNAPKGMAILDNRLYVADLDVVRIFNAATGEVLGKVDLSSFEPKYLNDITADSDGFLYVSDMDGNQLFRINTKEKHAVEVWMSGEGLKRPNGLFYDNHSNRLLIATWEGEILQIDEDKQVKRLKKGLVNLDGIFLDGRGDLYVSSFSEGEIYRIRQRGHGRLEQYQTGIATPADIGYDKNFDRILIPFMSENRVSSAALNRN